MDVFIGAAAEKENSAQRAECRVQLKGRERGTEKNKDCSKRTGMRKQRNWEQKGL